MNNPGNLSWKDKYILLKAIHKTRPDKWDDIAKEYGWLPGLAGGLKGNELHKYIMFGLQVLKKENFISVNITYESTRFDHLYILPKGKIYIYLFPVFRLLYWFFAVGIVSVAAIKTLCDGVALW